MDILKFDAARVGSSEYAAFSSVRPIKLKSMTPFPGYSNRHGSHMQIVENNRVKVAMKIIVRIIIAMMKFCSEIK